jgi:hypothetical protein
VPADTQYESKAFGPVVVCRVPSPPHNCIIELQREQVCLLPKRGHQSGSLPHTTQRLSGIVTQFPERFGAEVR